MGFLFEIIIKKASCFISVFVDEQVYKCVFVLNWTYMIIQWDDHSLRPHCNIVFSVEPALSGPWTVRRYKRMLFRAKNNYTHQRKTGHWYKTSQHFDAKCLPDKDILCWSVELFFIPCHIFFWWVFFYTLFSHQQSVAFP